MAGMGLKSGTYEYVSTLSNTGIGALDEILNRLLRPEGASFRSQSAGSGKRPPVWEISTKYRLGKLPEAASVAGNVPLWIEKAGFKPLAVTPQHAQLAGSWGMAHRDPFDRMLVLIFKINGTEFSN